MNRRILLAALLLLPGARARALTLDECLQAALAESPALEAARQRAAAAEQAVGQARSAWYPQVKVSAGYARTDNPPQAFMMSLNQRVLNMADPAFDPNQPDDTENLRLSAGAVWRLWDNGRRGLDQRMSELGAQAQALLKQAAYNDLAFQVTRAFYHVLQARATIDVQEQSVRSIEENLRVARERFEAGSAVQTDVLNLEVRWAEARDDLIRARNAQQLALLALNTAIGRDFVTADAVLSASETLPSPLPEPDAEDVEARGELQAARLLAEVRQAAWRKSVRDYGPTLNAFGSYDWDSDVSSDFEDSYLVGVAAELEVFDGKRRRAGNASARAAYQAAEADARQLRDQLTLDLRQAFLQMSEARERLEVAAKSVAGAEEAHRITRERYEQGAADLSELLTAEVGLTATRSRNVSARYDYFIARANTERAQGNLYQENTP